MFRNAAFAAALSALLLGPAASAQTTAAPDGTAATPALMTLDEVNRGALMLRSDQPGGYVAAPLVSTDIEIAVTGPIARAVVTQRFVNPAERWVEGIYAFPLPENAAVDRLRMRIGNRFIEGKIEEREQAREIYEAAKAEGKKAALVEQERPNLFTNSVANIGPGEVVVTQIAFQQALAPKEGRWEIRMPLVAAPRYNPDPVIQQVEFDRDGWAVEDPVPDRDRVEAPIADPRSEDPDTIRNPVELSVDLAPGFEIATLESPFHAITATEPEPGRAQIALTGPVPANRDFVLRWTPAEGDVRASLFRERVAGADHLLITLSPPDLGAAPPVKPREVIFVQDVSGSMSGTSIRQAREGLEMALRRLRPEDRFNIIVFNDDYAVYADHPLPATPDEIDKAVEAVRGLEAEGGTEMLPALDYALDDASPEDDYLRQVIFLTDGAVGNEAQMLALIDAELGRSRLFTVGIGSAPNSYFMRRAAEKGRGAHLYIGDLGEVAERMAELFAKIESPAITDLELNLPAGIEDETYPSPLPDLYAGNPLALAIKAPEAKGTAVLTGKRGAQDWRITLPLDQGAERPGVAKLWARRKIAGLEALALSPDLPAGGREKVDAELLATALDYGLVSRLTALVAVDVTPSRPSGEDVATAEVALNLPEGWDPEAFLFEMPDRGRPLIKKAVLQRLAPKGAPEQTGAPLPKGALDWRSRGLLGLALMLIGLLALIGCRFRPRARAVRP